MSFARLRDHQRLRMLLSLALTWVPLVLFAHSHSHWQAGMHGACDLCMAAHQTAATELTTEIVLAPISVCESSPAPRPVPLIHAFTARPSGRAPPPASPFA